VVANLIALCSLYIRSYDGKYSFVGDSSADFLGGLKHQWPYPSWNDIDVLSSPLFWTFIVLLSGGLYFAGRKTLLVLIPTVIISGVLGLFCGGIIAAYTVVLLPIVFLAFFRRNQTLAWGALIMVLISDLLLTLSYAMCFSDYEKMTSGPGVHKIPGELWEGMQNVFAFLIVHVVFTVILGVYIYRTRPGDHHLKAHL